MTEQHHLRDMQRYVANVGITASALRDLEGGGYVRTARTFLGDLDPNSLAAYQPSEYLEWLNEQTQALQAKFPEHFWWASQEVNQ